MVWQKIAFILFQCGQKWVRLRAALDLEHLVSAQSDDLTKRLGCIGVSLYQETWSKRRKRTINPNTAAGQEHTLAMALPYGCAFCFCFIEASLLLGCRQRTQNRATATHFGALEQIRILCHESTFTVLWQHLSPTDWLGGSHICTVFICFISRYIFKDITMIIII